jgi:hypothetical protein
VGIRENIIEEEKESNFCDSIIEEDRKNKHEDGTDDDRGLGDILDTV